MPLLRRADPSLLCLECAEQRAGADGGQIIRAPLEAECEACGHPLLEWSYLVARDRAHVRKLDRWIKGQQIAGITNSLARNTLLMVLGFAAAAAILALAIYLLGMLAG